MATDRTDISSEDERYMRMALNLAKKATGWTSPNPLVGAVIVKDGRIVGKGYHRKAGGPHAEIHALNEAGHLAQGATLYVNLEPCCHHGRTPPCTERIIAAGISRVVAAVEDPNPLVAGKGVKALKEAGIRVDLNVLRDEAMALNGIFIKYITTGRPFVTLKAAMTMDGKIATWAGDSKWITGEAARAYVHRLRLRHDAVMVGIGTVLKDNPHLTCRLRNGKIKQPIRIVVDSKARTPPDANVIKGPTEPRTIVAVTRAAPPDRIDRLSRAGAQVLVLEDDRGRVDMVSLAEELGRQGITSVLLEGGGELNASAIAAGVVDKVMVFIAPKIAGGSMAPTYVEGPGVELIKDAIALTSPKIRRFGEDIMLEAYFKKPSDVNVMKA